MSGNPPEIGLKSRAELSLGPLVFDYAGQRLRHPDGTPVDLRRQTADVLARLAETPGEIVTKEDLIDAAWDRGYVSDDSVTQCIFEIRKALGDAGHDILRTFPKRGYMLVPGATLPAGRRSFNIGVGALGAIAVVILAYLFLPMHSEYTGTDGRPAIAVLAFDDLSVGDDKGWLSDGVSEGIITELARFPELLVMARNSSFAFRDAPVDITDIREKLGVNYIVEGSQQKNGNRLRVTVQLIDAGNGGHVWAESFDRDLGDFFDVQSEIVRTIAAAVGSTVATTPLDTARGRKAVEALHYHLQAMDLMKNYSRENSDRAAGLYGKALAADPASPYGYIGMAFHYRSIFNFGWGDLSYEEARRRAEDMAEKALEIAPDNYLAHYVRARIHAAAGESELAIQHFERAAQLNPSSSRVFLGWSSPLLYSGETDNAIEVLNHAMRIDPLHASWGHWQMSWALWQAGDCDGAVQAMQRMDKISPTAHKMLAAAYACLGRADESHEAMAVFLKEKPDATIADEIERYGAPWTAPGALDRWVADMRLAGMPE